MVAGQAADATGTVTESHGVLRRQAAAVTDDTTRIAHHIRVLEPTRRSEVEGSEGTRLTQKMTRTAVSMDYYVDLDITYTHGLGRGAVSSNELTRGECTGVLDR